MSAENPSAFPIPATVTQAMRPSGPGEDGMSLRDYFAAKAMQALTPIYWDQILDYENAPALLKCLSESAYETADAMLAERNK